jgi:hypothetical protein
VSPSVDLTSRATGVVEGFNVLRVVDSDASSGLANGSKTCIVLGSITRLSVMIVKVDPECQNLGIDVMIGSSDCV